MLSTNGFFPGAASVLANAAVDYAGNAVLAFEYARNAASTVDYVGNAGLAVDYVGNTASVASNYVTDTVTSATNYLDDMTPQTLKPVVRIAGPTVIGAGAIVGLVSGGFYLVGLSSVGPVAGGWFAANMGAGLSSGSAMAIFQSAAMTTGTYTTAAIVGASAGAGVSVTREVLCTACPKEVARQVPVTELTEQNHIETGLAA